MDALFKPDLHMHTRFSDGTDTPEELLCALKTAGITVFSVTDHDCIDSAFVIPKYLTKDSPVFIPGVEFSCRDNGGKYHILGYGYDYDDEGINGVVEHGHKLRMEKTKGRLEMLKTEYGYDFPEEEVSKLLSNKNPGKPHIAAMMVKYGYAENKDSAIYDCLNRLHYASGYVSPEEAISGILKSGGIPVLAHPFYGSGDDLILGDEMDKRLKRLIGYGLKGIEAYYSGFSEKLRQNALALADKYDLLVTAGSDYHGNNKTVLLGDTGLTERNFRLEKFLSAVSK